MQSGLQNVLEPVAVDAEPEISLDHQQWHRHHQALRLEERMEQEDLHHDRHQQHQRQGGELADQQQEPSRDLDDLQHGEEITGRA